MAAYVNLDGQEENPKVRTLALWAERSGPTGPEGRHMEGAENVTIPDQTHVQSSTSTQSFQQIYKFFRRKLPEHDIVPQKSIQLAGKALEFPQNTGLVGDTVEVWPLNSSGERTTKTPIHKYQTQISAGRQQASSRLVVTPWVRNAPANPAGFATRYVTATRR